MKNIRNLTGHTIRLFDKKGKVIRDLLPDEYIPPVKVTLERKMLGYWENFPLVEYERELNYKELILSALENISNVLVSSVSARSLEEAGYKGNIWVIGNKVLGKNGVEGTYKLSLYKRGEIK